jgi:Tol biopolymer transport system component
MRYFKLAVGAAVVIGLMAAGFAPGLPGRKAKPSPKRVGYLAYWGYKELWTCRLDGSEPRRILNNFDNAGGFMEFSRSGGLLAWWSSKTRDDKDSSQLWVWPVVAGGRPKSIFTQKSIPLNTDVPSFTPDGRSIVFGRGELGLWQIGVDGSHLRRLAECLSGNGDYEGVSVSPDGKLVASIWTWWESEDKIRQELVLLNRADGKMIRTGLKVQALAWSTKGQLALLQYREDGEDSWQRLVLYQPATKQVTPLIDYSLASMMNLSFSPDGGKLAFFSTKDDFSYSLMVMDIAARRTSELTALTVNWAWMQWGPDGSRIFYGTSGHGDSYTNIYSIRADGKDDRLLVREKHLAGVFEIPETGQGQNP